MSEMVLNYQDINSIMINNLKVESISKRIDSIFLNKRNFSRINYKPYFQREYVWDKDKASYFIESIFLGTEIPPIVFFSNGKNIEIIDGRQRFETIKRFLLEDFILSKNSLSSLPELSGNKLSDLNEELQNRFKETTIRILQYSVVNEPSLKGIQQDMIKKEIFRRYNSGITSLKPDEIQRARFIDNTFTVELKKEIENSNQSLNILKELFLSSIDKNKLERDKCNIIVNRIRMVVATSKIPIRKYVQIKNKRDDIYYYSESIIDSEFNGCESETVSKIIKYTKTMNKINQFLKKREAKDYYGITLSNNRLVFESLLWAFLIIDNKNKDLDLNNELIETISTYLLEGNQHFDITGSHYYKRIIDRYSLIKDYFIKEYNFIFFNLAIDGEKRKLNKDTKQENSWKEIIIKRNPVSMQIDDICNMIQKKRFLIRPPYQRSETISKVKASALIESIMLNIKIPPLFIYKREDGVSEVIDGQQRLLSIIGYLNCSYRNENGDEEFPLLSAFQLINLRILSKLNGADYDCLESDLLDKLYDFNLDIIEIDEKINPDFDKIDLFLRLNTKPYPVKDNTFEMWNAYGNKNIISKVKDICKDDNYKWFFRKDSNHRMKNEELLTSLAFLDYTKNTEESVLSALGIYIRNDRVTARITSKSKITKLLERCNFDNSDVTMLNSSIDNIINYIDRIDTLLDSERKQEKMDELIFKSKRTDRDYYLLWYMLSNINLNEIRRKRTKIFQQIKRIFKSINVERPDLTTEKLIKEIDLAMKSVNLL